MMMEGFGDAWFFFSGLQRNFAGFYTKLIMTSGYPLASNVLLVMCEAVTAPFSAVRGGSMASQPNVRGQVFFFCLLVNKRVDYKILLTTELQPKKNASG